MNLKNLKAGQDAPIVLLRIALSIIVALHGWARFLNDAVVPFGEFLDASGFPLGFWIAATITFYEIVGSVALVVGWYIKYLSYIFCFIYFMGIVLVHYPEGWFVVGLGRNGMEYSVLLIVCFLIVGHSNLDEQGS